MLYIQDPSNEDSKLLLDALLEGCNEAVSGAGAYAFVSADGVNLLMEDPIFREFLTRGQFHLIVGMDEITNTRTLAALNRHKAQFPNLQVNAFLHNTTGSTFHPKFCWFDCGEYGFVITGSGNLTQKGLQRNREAFELKRVDIVEMAAVRECWTTWLASVQPFIMPLDDAAVANRAEENRLRMRTMRRAEIRLDEEPQDTTLTTEDVVEVYTDDELGAWEYDITARVLIAEIPRGGGRWNQANFDANTFSTYFESVPGVAGQMALILRDVKWDGSLGEIRHRPPVSVQSQNYRVELYVERGIEYPAEEDGRVIGVFAKLSARTFLYMLVFPTHAEHPVLDQTLNNNRHRADRLVRYPTTARELTALAPTLPILQYLSRAE